MIKKLNKKLLSIVLCIVLITQLLPSGVFALTSSQATAAVTQHVTTVPVGYKAIKTAADLNAVRNNLIGKYILMNDIDLTAATAKGGAYYYSGKGWNPIGYTEDFIGVGLGINLASQNPFSGIFDGNGYSIKGMSINSTGSLGIGLFSDNVGTIKNLTMSGSKITVTSNTMVYAGSITGSNSNGGTVSNCSSRNEVTAVSNGGFKFPSTMTALFKTLMQMSDEDIQDLQDSLDAGFACAGGVAGYNTGSISNCYNTGKVSATGRDEAAAGGIVGASMEGSTINDCYNTGLLSANAVSGDYSSGGIAGGIDGGTVSNCYYLNTAAGAFGNIEDTEGIIKCTSDQMKLQSTFADFDFASIWRLDKDNTYQYPTLRIFFNPVTKITLNITSLKLAAGKTGALTAAITPTNADVKTVTWTSSNSNIVTVDSTGKIKAVATGTATVTCTANDRSGAKATCTIIVPKLVTAIKLSATSLKWAVGKTGTLTATITPTDATDKSVTWTSSNSKVATVSSTGVVKAIGLGTTNITCTAKDGSGIKSVCPITVGKPVTSIKLNATSLKWTVGKTGKLVPTITPSDAINKSVTWSTSNKSVATVDSAGYVKVVGIGTAAITCTAVDGSGKKATCIVTGIPGTPTGVKAVKASTTSIKLTWSNVTGVTGYEVYRSLSKTGTYTKIKTVTSTTYTNTGLTKGKTYYYKITAYKTVGTTTIRSASSAIVYYKL